MGTANRVCAGRPVLSARAGLLECRRGMARAQHRHELPIQRHPPAVLGARCRCIRRKPHLQLHTASRRATNSLAKVARPLATNLFGFSNFDGVRDMGIVAAAEQLMDDAVAVLSSVTGMERSKVLVAARVVCRVPWCQRVPAPRVDKKAGGAAGSRGECACCTRGSIGRDTHGVRAQGRRYVLNMASERVVFACTCAIVQILKSMSIVSSAHVFAFLTMVCFFLLYRGGRKRLRRFSPSRTLACYGPLSLCPRSFPRTRSPRCTHAGPSKPCNP